MAGAFVRVSGVFRRALRRALELAAETGGIVDPTIGRQTEIFEYGPEVEPAELAATLEGVMTRLMGHLPRSSRFLAQTRRTLLAPLP